RHDDGGGRPRVVRGAAGAEPPDRGGGADGAGPAADLQIRAAERGRRRDGQEAGALQKPPAGGAAPGAPRGAMDGPRPGLIIPPSSFLLDERVFPSLGVLRLAAVAERSGVPVSVLDLSGAKVTREVVGRWRARFQPTHVGVTATTAQYPAALGLV